MNILKSKSTEKIFCIGLNKTGTTSLERTLIEMGFKMGEQREGENLLEEWAKRNFKPIIKFSNSAEGFQDIPFSLPFTYQALDQSFPNAKFILSVRNSPDEWYQSLINFHSKLWSNGSQIPSKEDLKAGFYIYKGWSSRAISLIFNTPEDDPYNKEQMIAFYNRHLENTREYFRFKKERFIEINLSHEDDYYKLCSFLGKSPIQRGFPWLNKT